MTTATQTHRTPRPELNDRLPPDPRELVYWQPHISRVRLVEAHRRRLEAEALRFADQALRAVGYRLVPAEALSWRQRARTPRAYLRRRAWYIVPAADEAAGGEG